MDVTEISLPDASLDAIVCNHVLEHIPDDRRALSEFFRVLRPQGWAILQVPISLSLVHSIEDATANTPSKRFSIFGQEDHVRIYGRDYLDRLEQSGFTVTVLDSAQLFGVEAVNAITAAAQTIPEHDPDVDRGTQTTNPVFCRIDLLPLGLSLPPDACCCK